MVGSRPSYPPVTENFFVKIRERDVEKHLVRRVKEAGGEVRKLQWVGRRGAPDRVVMFPPRFTLTDCFNLMSALPAITAWPEIKAPGEKPEPHQAREHERMRAMGQWVLVLDSFEAVDKFIKGCGR